MLAQPAHAKDLVAFAPASSTQESTGTAQATGADAGKVKPAPTTAQEKANVMVMGVFHFANPGQDMVKSRVINVMTGQNQAYLDDLATRLAAFHPTDVLIECTPNDQVAFQKNFDAYRKGAYALTSNELDQIGFRVAKATGIETITCFDEQTIGWDAGPMFEYVKTNDPKMQAGLDTLFKSLSERTTQEQTTLTLPQLLQMSNDPARDRENKSMYLLTNAVDAGGSFAGADAASSWWHRNFRMYANVQKAAAPGHRVLVLAGSGHTAILKDLLAVDSQRQSVDVSGYLTP
ncbi:MAG: DUF5694 domain-containing protein [Thermomonas sp.]